MGQRGWSDLATADPLGALPQGYISGLETSNGTDSDHDIDITTGVTRDSSDSANMLLESALTKQIDANWTEGTNLGGFPSSLTLTADTWYHVFLIRETSSGTIDAGFDTSITATNLLSDSGYNQFRRIGSVLTDSSSNILGFTQNNDTFMWDATILDVDATDGITATLRIISVPVDLTVEALLNVKSERLTSQNSFTYVSFPSVDDEDVASQAVAPLSSVGGFALGATDTGFVNLISVLTDTSARIRTRSQSITTLLKIATLGWKDSRGKE